jgi:hypothetical protein
MMFRNLIDLANTTSQLKRHLQKHRKNISFHSWLVFFSTYRRPARKQHHVNRAGAKGNITYLLIYIFLLHFARPVKGKSTQAKSPPLYGNLVFY